MDSLLMSGDYAGPLMGRFAPGSWLDRAAKRAFDFFVALIGLIFLAPLFVVLGLMIRHDSPGPVFYGGPRVGRGGKPFKILKFRTMREDAASYAGPRVTAQDDPRITPLGKWLRDTKLNELPQLWNVLKGEMSLVGPRPEDPELARSWPQDVYDEVLSLRPGITSPASVVYRNEESLLQSADVMDTYLESILPSKLRLDQLYVHHRTFWLDLDIIFWTALVLLPRLGDRSLGEERLFAGPVTRLMQRYVNWFTIDMLVTFASIGLTGIIWRLSAPLDVGWSKAIFLALGFAFLFSLIGALLGANRIAWSSANASDAIELVLPVVLSSVAMLSINAYLVPGQAFPAPMLLMAAILALGGFVAVRYRSRLLSGLATRWLVTRGKAFGLRERVLIVGGGEAGQFVAWILQNGKTRDAYHVVGFADDDLYKQDMRFRGVRVLGRRSDIPRLIKKHDIGLIMFAIHNISAAERQEVLHICQSTRARLVEMPDILGEIRFISNQGGRHGTGPLPTLELATWLSQAEEVASQGDLAAVQQQLQNLRLRLGADAPK